MKYSILIPLFFCIAVCCTRSYDQDDNGAANGHIRGRLFVYDVLTTQKLNVPLAGKTLNIYYQESTSDSNFLFATQTDKDGYFVFNQLLEGRHYRIKYEERSDSDRIYTGIRENIKADLDTLTVIAGLNLAKENGLHYTVHDANGQPVKGATVCLYNNQEYYQPTKCENSAYSLVTDAYGHAFKFNIPQGTYYTAGYITVNGSLYKFDDVQTVTTSKILVPAKTLVKVIPPEFNYIVKDEDGNLLANATLCFFTSKIARDAEACDLANLSNKKSNVEGKVKITELPPGHYYVLAKWEYEDKKLKNIEEEIDIVNGPPPPPVVITLKE